jgi:hypothetical protein
MENDKQPLEKNEQSGTPQAAQGNDSKINPFKDAAGEQPQEQTIEGENELEQQRKEAMTERD